MKKIILVDGNNLMFRSYYATAYTGNLMKNSKGFPTNALYGFVNMMNKIIDEEKPSLIAVAFDVGKNFRKNKYEEYKAGRNETPEDLKKQMPIARKILDAMGIKHFELEPYEADDIIGTLAAMVDKSDNMKATIVSSDRDLLQLISDDVEVKLLKQKGFIRYNKESFYNDFLIKPINIIDLKALAGDSSDNIPGVKGVGEKTALSLLKEHKTLENIYANIDKIKGKLQEKLITDQKQAFFSKELATIYKEVPLEISDLEGIKYGGANASLEEIYSELEFYSLMKNHTKKRNLNNAYVILENINDLKIEDEVVSFYIECDNENYHIANVLGMAISDKNNNYFINKELFKDVFKFLEDKILYTYDLKKSIVLLNKMGISLHNCIYDAMIATSMLYDNLKDDFAYYMNNQDVSVPFYEEIRKAKFDEILVKEETALKSRFILDSHDDLILKLKTEDMYDLFASTEMPLIRVLAKMEISGVMIKADVLENMLTEINEKIENLSLEIYDYAGVEFNISSPRQLGDVLFAHLGLPYGKRNQKGFKTDVKVLHKLQGLHPIIEPIMKYRALTKLKSTYIEGLPNYILEDNKIHTIYNQTLTRTGRLSSMYPNLQNIPTRDEEGKKIRKSFIPSNDMFLSADYSQIELRILAHISGAKELIKAFVEGKDIHRTVASDIFGVSESEVTSKMRSTAKAVIFGIVYGISGFGLGENLSINPKEAKGFIDKYLELYPGVKRYMDGIVKEAYEQGYVTTLYKRKRKIEELNSKVYPIRSAGERIALNTPIQGTSADIIKKAMVAIDKEFMKENIQSKMLLQVHDELIFDVKEEEKTKVENIVKTIMENIVKLNVPLKVSMEYGKNWYETK